MGDNIINWQIKEYNKMEKTFREVIADIKEGEVWENKYTEIYTEDCKIQFKSKTGFNENVIAFLPEEGGKYKLQREQYTFTEAFKAYEEGKEIESELTGDTFKKNREGSGLFHNEEYHFDSSCLFSINALKGKWYIN